MGAWRGSEVTEPTLSLYPWQHRVKGWRTEKWRETEIDGEGQSSFKPLPHQQSLPDRAGAVN